MHDLYTSPRVEAYRWEAQTLSGAPLGTLDGVTSGHIEQNVFADIRGTGSLEWAGDATESPAWATMQVQPFYRATTPYGVLEWPLGVYLCSAPGKDHTDTHVTAKVELFDRTLHLKRAKITATYSIAVGANVVAAVKALLAPFGLVSIPDSAETASTANAWAPGTETLRIVNDLLSSVNYFSLWADGWGQYRSEPYRAPLQRPVEWEFRDDEDGVYVPEWSEELDLFEVPNRFTCTSTTEGEAVPFRSTATNTDPESPTSYQARGNNWVDEYADNVEATTQAVLDQITLRRLVEASQKSATIGISHVQLPFDLNSVVTFEHNRHGKQALCVVQKQSIECKPGSMVSATLLEVSI